MVGTITPLVKGAKLRWSSATGLHLIGSVVAATLLGAAVSGIGSRMLGAASFPAWGTTSGYVLGVLGIAFGLQQLDLVRLPELSLRRSVPKAWWLRFGENKASLIYGIVLGSGVGTPIPFSSYHWLLVLTLLTGNVIYGAAVMGTYGLGRALPVISAAPFVLKGYNTSDIMFWMRAHRPAWRYVNGAALLWWLGWFSVRALQSA